MSDEATRQQTGDIFRSNPGMEKVTETQVNDYDKRNTINNEIDRLRREQDEQRNRQG